MSRAMAYVVAYVTGLTFGVGLIVAGMANPAKVLAFLDVAGRWDPSLALVMVGAISVAVVTFALAKNRTASVLGLPMYVPAAGVVDKKLVSSSALFGVGWGLAGICPGPALVLAGTGAIKGGMFLIAMLSGMAVFELIEAGKK